MLRNPLLILSFYVLPIFTIAQINLIPNGSFERVSFEGCIQLWHGFNNTDDWYAMSSSPDLFRQNCPLPEIGWIFWNDSLDAFDGEFYAGLACRLQYNGAFFPEGMATTLRQPLEKGVTYQLEFYLRPKGLFHDIDSNLVDCLINPDKHLEVYGGSERIYSVVEEDSIYQAIHSYCTGHHLTDVTSEALNSTRLGDWTHISTCLTARGGETYLGITMPTGHFEAYSPCSLSAEQGHFQWFYYDIDGLSLVEIPGILDTTVTFCEGEEIILDLTDMWSDLPTQGVQYIWNDGHTGALRTISESDDYKVQAQFTCSVSEINVHTVHTDCELKIFVPNVFSPNGDGVNDLFQPLITSFTPINNFEMVVYDRWGNPIHRATDPQDAWDGRFGDSDYVNPGVYTWIVRLEHDSPKGTDRIVKSGTITVLR